MTPPANLLRRHALADAAIEILGTCGIHRLSHRAVDESAGVPSGTTSNYFRNRDGLLQATARRIVDLHLEDMARDIGDVPATAAERLDQNGLADLIGQSLYQAATQRRVRFQAIFELLLEATRTPALGHTLSEISTATLRTTIAHHRALGLETSPEQVRTLTALYSGALFTLVTGPPQPITTETTRTLARTIVNGVLGTPGPRE
ncbi:MULTISPECIES: TetR/AcrR family transcriptional regulator [Actinomadura]|uniref:TetR/AcrR family transcriptional regulator n=1 Tax=Actinomadura yumaensis TaxID=111807 RepID=A0ABW2CPW7_9ACTN|nr:TetR family transcriptional regulator [Actinomadura sp. J1-007]